MPRLSIDVTPEQHKAIKAQALIQDKSMKDLLLEPLFSSTSSDEAFHTAVVLANGDVSGKEEDGWVGLDEVLMDRVASAERQEFSEETLEQMFQRAVKRHREKSKAA